MTTNQSEDVLEDLEFSNTTSDKVHPWRVCPIGKHYVRTHVLHVPPSRKHPQGQVVTRHAHCADNPSHEDMLSYDELHAIAETHFLGLKGLPKANVLTEFPRADEFDKYIRGWVQYWQRLHHTATWDDAIAEYKGILKAIVENKDPNHNPDPYNEMPIFRSFYKRLQEP